MSIDIRFIAFNEKKADEFWKSLQIFRFHSLFEAWDKEREIDVASVQDELIEEDLYAGGIIGVVDEGKHFHYYLQLLVDAFRLDPKARELLLNNFEIAPKQAYLALFDLVSEDEISKRFSDNEIASSILVLYENLKDTMIALRNLNSALYIDVNSEVLNIPYFIDRAKRHLPIVQTLYSKWREAGAASHEKDEENTGSQTPLF